VLTLKKTPLNEQHKNLGAKLVDFAGYEMPVQYSGIIAEHNAVRKNIGIFDVSHMGEFLVTGKDSFEYLNNLIPNDINKLKKTNKGLYTQICNENGGTVDDLIIYKRPVGFLVVVNASNIEKDWKHFNKYKEGFEVELEDISEETSLIAIQGPNAEKVLSKILIADLSKLNYFENISHRSEIIARTGYTGEDGFEVFIHENPMKASEIWRALIREGATPCGLGARDTLRLEAAYPLYGHELDDETSPLEAGLGWSVKLDKPNESVR
jgi:glycine cleavage system T protein